MDTLSKVVLGVVSVAVAVTATVATIAGSRTPKYGPSYGNYPPRYPQQQYQYPQAQQYPTQYQQPYVQQTPVVPVVNQAPVYNSQQECKWVGDDNLYQFCSGPKGVYSNGFNNHIMNAMNQQTPYQFGSANGYGYGYGYEAQPQQGCAFNNYQNINMSYPYGSPAMNQPAYGNPYDNNNYNGGNYGCGGGTQAFQPSPFPSSFGSNQPMSAPAYSDNQGFASAGYGGIDQPMQQPVMQQPYGGMSTNIPPQTPLTNPNNSLDPMDFMRELGKVSKNDISQVPPMNGDLFTSATAPMESIVSAPVESNSQPSTSNVDQPVSAPLNGTITGMNTAGTEMSEQEKFLRTITNL